MPDKIKDLTILTAESTAKSLGKYLAIGFAGLILWGGVESIPYVTKKISDHKQNVKISAQKKAEMNRIDDAIKDWDYGNASVLLDKIKKDNNHSQGELVNLESSVKNINEDNLFKEIKSCNDMVSRIKLCEKYISRFDNGKYFDDVMHEKLYVGRLSLLDSFQSGQEFKSAYIKLKDFVSDLEIGITKKYYVLDGKLPPLIQEGQKYLEAQKQVPNKISIGGRVKINGALPYKWYSDYFDERQKLIPKGSIGEVMDIPFEGIYVLKFENIEKNNWKSKWWQDGKWLDKGEYLNKINCMVAPYFKDEIEPTIPINPLEEDLFLKELDKLRNLAAKIGQKNE